MRAASATTPSRDRSRTIAPLLYGVIEADRIAVACVFLLCRRSWFARFAAWLRGTLGQPRRSRLASCPNEAFLADQDIDVVHDRVLELHVCRAITAVPGPDLATVAFWRFTRAELLRQS